MVNRKTVLMGAFVFVFFVLGTLLINVITGTQLSGGTVLAAIISGVIFTVLYSIGMYIWAKRQAP